MLPAILAGARAVAAVAPRVAAAAPKAAEAATKVGNAASKIGEVAESRVGKFAIGMLDKSGGNTDHSQFKPENKSSYTPNTMPVNNNNGMRTAEFGGQTTTNY